MWLAVRAGHAFPILVPCMSCPVVDGRQWRRFEDAHASYPRHALLPRGLNPWKGRRRENSENALRFFTFINYIGWKFFINTLKKLTKLRPHRPSVMFSTPPVAPKSCDSKWFFVFARDCRHRTQIPLIFGEKGLLYSFLLYTSPLNK